MQVFVVGSFVIACSVKVARLPGPGESLDAAAFVSEPGGKGFNLALAAQRLGAGVDGLFAIGTDVFATVAEATFARLGFPARMLVRREGSTGAGVGFVDPAGENCLAVCLGANLALDEAEIRCAAPRLLDARLVAATFESPDAPIREAFARARANGALTLLNPSPTRPIAPDILANTAILIVNAVEAAALGLGDPAADAQAEIHARSQARHRPGPVDALLRAGPELVVVTLGERGAVAFRAGAPPCRQPAFAVSAVDTVGAGDAFAAGLLTSLLEGRPLDEALRRAAACGALTTLRFGAFDAFPTRAMLDRFLASEGGAGGGRPLRRPQQ